MTFTHPSHPVSTDPMPNPTAAATVSTHARAPAITSTATATSARGTTQIKTTNADDGAPPQEQILTDPAYRLDGIDRTVPEQVAWAYLTLRLSYSYQDTDPDEHNRQAATYASPALSRVTAATGPAAAAGTAWAEVVDKQVRAVVKVTDMYFSLPAAESTGQSGQILLRIAWIRVLSNELNAPVRTSGATTMTLQQQPTRTWLVVDYGFAEPN